MYRALLPNTDYKDEGRGHDRRVIELQLYDWLQLDPVIELDRTHLKILLVEHNPGGGGGTSL